MSADVPRYERPIFLLGVTPRSGTNYLGKVIQLDPRAALPAPLVEDGLLRRADHLTSYVSGTMEPWKQWLQDESPEELEQELYQLVGEGMLQFLKKRIPEGCRLFCKTPFTDNIDLFFRLFPQALLVILVRDGRDVVVSSKRTWPDRNEAFFSKRWASSARRILEFTQGEGRKHQDQWALFRYEELVGIREGARRLVAFLGVHEDAVPWEEFDDMKIVGSSTARGGKSKVHWKPVEKTADFKPVGRWHDWSPEQKAEFKKLAGPELIELGYVDDDTW